jgi:rhomboid protease GluP
MCPNCRAFITTDDRVCPYCDVKVGPKAVEQRTGGAVLGGLIPQVRFTTMMILLINFGLFLAEMISPQTHLSQYGASLPWPYLHGEWWRLVTAGFLHGGIIHILMNSYVLFDLGAEVEALYGTSRLIVFYFVSTVTGFFTSSYIGGHESLGSSAGIFGLIGAMLAFGLTDRSALGAQVKALYSRWVIYGLVMSLIPGLGIDLYAHIGGLAGGFLTGFIASTPRARLMWKEPVIRYAAVACLVLTALSLGRMFLAIFSTPA